MIDFQGHMCQVMFTAGCNFRCAYCHNAEMIHASRGNLSWNDVARVLDRAAEQWVDAVCLSGGEPAVHGNLSEIVTYLKARGFLIKLDTNGSVPARLRQVADLVDYVAMDYKAPLAQYEQIVGVDVDTQCIRDSIAVLKECYNGRYEVRTTVVEGIHDINSLERMGQELAGVQRYVLQPFVPQEGLYDPRWAHMERTSIEFLEQASAVVARHVESVTIRGAGM